MTIIYEMIEVLLKSKNRIYKIKKNITKISSAEKDFATIDEFHRIERLCLLLLYRYYDLLTSDMRKF